MKAGFVQFDCRFGQKSHNLQQAAGLISATNADLWVLPELFNTGYYFTAKQELTALSEPTPEGETTEFLIDLAKKYNTAIIAGIAERANDRFFNTAIFVDGKGLISSYRKIHLFNREKIWFTPGDRAFDVVPFKSTIIGIMICFDWIFPEAARTLALLGADIIVHPSNLVLPYCQSAMITRCIENGVYAITANRVGTEIKNSEALTFTGQSQIVSPRGEILVRAESDEDVALVKELDLTMARNKKFTDRNDLFSDRKVEFYSL